MTADPHFDPAALARLVRFGGLKLLGGMVEIFRDSAPERVQQMRAGLAAGDPALLRLALHSLKSSAAQLGALHLSGLSRAGEELATRGDAPSLRALAPLVDTVDMELARALDWMERTRADLQSPAPATNPGE